MSCFTMQDFDTHILVSLKWGQLIVFIGVIIEHRGVIVHRIFGTVCGAAVDVGRNPPVHGRIQRFIRVHPGYRWWGSIAGVHPGCERGRRIVRRPRQLQDLKDTLLEIPRKLGDDTTACGSKQDNVGLDDEVICSGDNYSGIYFLKS